eukprot:GHRQ01012630.1.p1 GENE.GHRQ01012630.1~~GHRQ01012630.1.p1  ORF type:complete len:163 (+),score=11.90 GHRQ01012630.1:631-1119(+)
MHPLQLQLPHPCSVRRAHASTCADIGHGRGMQNAWVVSAVCSLLVPWRMTASCTQHATYMHMHEHVCSRPTMPTQTQAAARPIAARARHNTEVLYARAALHANRIAAPLYYYALLLLQPTDAAAQPLLCRGAQRMMSSTRRIISAASVALSSTCGTAHTVTG